MKKNILLVVSVTLLITAIILVLYSVTKPKLIPETTLQIKDVTIIIEEHYSNATSVKATVLTTAINKKLTAEATEFERLSDNKIQLSLNPKPISYKEFKLGDVATFIDIKTGRTGSPSSYEVIELKCETISMPENAMAPKEPKE